MKRGEKKTKSRFERKMLLVKQQEGGKERERCVISGSENETNIGIAHCVMVK